MKTYQLYFYSEEGIIRAMCVKCHDEKYPEEKFFYYEGEFGHTADIKCNICKNFIRKYEDD